MKKKNSSWINPLFAMALASLLLMGCPEPVEEDTVQTTTVSDVEGNVYQTVTIGTQVWMAENLKTTKFRDQSAIPLVTDNATWENLKTPGYCWYDNDATTYKANKYGSFYNWYAVNTNKLCPAGWHVPTQNDWRTLANYLGGFQVAGGKMKEAGTIHWYTPNLGATNETGFNALPTGCRDNGGIYTAMGKFCCWWSSDEQAGTTNAYGSGCWSDNAGLWIESSGGKKGGLSVRCVKD